MTGCGFRRFAAAAAAVLIGCSSAQAQSASRVSFSQITTEPGLGRVDLVLAVADLNGDGRDDIVAGGREEYGFNRAVFLRRAVGRRRGGRVSRGGQHPSGVRWVAAAGWGIRQFRRAPRLPASRPFREVDDSGRSAVRFSIYRRLEVIEKRY